MLLESLDMQPAASSEAGWQDTSEATAQSVTADVLGCEAEPPVQAATNAAQSEDAEDGDFQAASKQQQPAREQHTRSTSHSADQGHQHARDHKYHAAGLVNSGSNSQAPVSTEQAVTKPDLQQESGDDFLQGLFCCPITQVAVRLAFS